MEKVDKMYEQMRNSNRELKTLNNKWKC
jgi:hypothetical protein